MFTKLKYYFGKNNYIMLKAQNYFLAKTYFHIQKSLTHGKYKSPIFQKYFFYKIYGNYTYFFHNHPWQNYSFCRDDQAQRSSTTKAMYITHGKTTHFVGMTKLKEA